MIFDETDIVIVKHSRAIVKIIEIDNVQICEYGSLQKLYCITAQSDKIITNNAFVIKANFFQKLIFKIKKIYYATTNSFRQNRRSVINRY